MPLSHNEPTIYDRFYFGDFGGLLPGEQGKTTVCF